MICDALRYLVPFVQFKKREKYPWTSITFKVTLLHECFSRFLNLRELYCLYYAFSIKCFSDSTAYQAFFTATLSFCVLSNFCQIGTRISLLVRPVILSGSTRLRLNHFVVTF